MGEKANIPSDELAAAATSGSLLRDQAQAVGEGVRDQVVEHGVDAVITRPAQQDEEQPDTGKGA